MTSTTNATSAAPGVGIIDRLKGITGRECGKCAYCCKLLPILELNKPGWTWCKHCIPGRLPGGCTLYGQPERPRVCGEAACLWLVSVRVPEYWKPLRSKMVLGMGRDADNKEVLSIYVDDSCPDRWKEEPYISDISEWVRQSGNGTRFKVKVHSPKLHTQLHALEPAPTMETGMAAAMNSVRPKNKSGSHMGQPE